MISKLYGIEYMVLFWVSENGLQGFGIAAPCLALNWHTFIPVADKEIQLHTGILMIIVQLAPHLPKVVGCEVLKYRTLVSQKVPFKYA